MHIYPSRKLTDDGGVCGHVVETLLYLSHTAGACGRKGVLVSVRWMGGWMDGWMDGMDATCTVTPSFPQSYSTSHASLATSHPYTYVTKYTT